ncbi:helix-turn-helix domain-containing protein [Lactococcus protaetiae]|uniref:Helix-turn-helix transcriptional regulator n=1 Tax=Lactococcus protaetiae TaxID=2592653 RepID=A0A514Z838_9LACT|nr:helix-turn-helix transcriptional regulator [Lactococcus protaetiae]QDK70733.1 helix-turn-helix transcriptional regulator [Lactococcus protaetiae]
MIDFERIEKLVSKSGKSMNEIDRELGYPRNTLAGLRNRKPSIGRLNEIAEYFNVSTDYLLGRKESKNNEELTEEENDLVAAFRMERKDMTKEEQIQFNKALKNMMKVAKDLLNDESNWKK